MALVDKYAGDPLRSGMGGLGQQAGELGRTGEHRPVPRLDVHVIDVPGFSELRYLASLDPLAGLCRGKLRADQRDRYVEPPLVSQLHDSLRHSFGDSDRGVRDAATQLPVKVSGVRAFERAPSREWHDTACQFEEVGVLVAVL